LAKRLQRSSRTRSSSRLAKGSSPPARAVEYYGQFTELWKDADAGLQPRVREARDRIARLSLR